MTRPVLVVDDDPRILGFVKKVLESESYEVECAETGEKALHLFSDREYEVALVDLNLPGIDGLDLLVNLRKLDETCVVMVLSGSTSVEGAVTAMKRGAFEYLVKPIRPSVLQQATRKASSHAKLLRQNIQLQRVVERQQEGGPIISRSATMQRTVELAERVAGSNSPVLIHGETGSGKGLIARHIHHQSPRRSKAFIHVNCGSLPEQLVESELFGHEEGAYTGAVTKKAGLFEVSDQGTLFLDEIGELALPSQAKLLQALDTGEIRRVGGTKVRRVDCRLVAATNKELGAEVAAGRFREDLLFRLNVLEMRVPGLRERPEDLEDLCRHYLVRYGALGSSPARLSEAAWRKLKSYRWPGNVRELRNVIERACLLSMGEEILPADLRLPEDQAADSEGPASDSLRELERVHIRAVLRRTDGNRSQAAKLLGIDVKTLRRKIKGFGLE